MLPSLRQKVRGHEEEMGCCCSIGNTAERMKSMEIGAVGAISHLDFIQYCSLLISGPPEVCQGCICSLCLAVK